MHFFLFFFFFSSRRRHTRSLCDWSSDVCSSDLQLDGFLVVAFLVPVLLAASWPAFARQARRERDPSLVKLLVAALLLKLFGSLVRYWVAVAFYDSNADAFEYHRVGVDLAMRFRAGNFDTGLASLSG